MFCNVCTGIIFVAVSLLYLFNSKRYHTCDNCGINHDNIILPLTQREKPSHVSSALQFQSTYYYDHVNSTTATFQQTTPSHDINPSTVRDIKLSDVHDIKPSNVRDINPSGVRHIDPVASEVARQRSRNIKSFHIRKYSKMMETCRSECINSKGQAPIPKQVFFIKTDRKWQYTEWIAVLSVHKYIKPDVIYIVSKMAIEPNCWWNRTLAIPAVTHVIPEENTWVTEIRGMKFSEPAHVCDFMKTTVLYEMGGILMDTDAIAIKSFDPLLTYQAVLARDQGGFVVNGLMISQKRSCFMCNFAVNSYHRYNGNWNTHSTWTLNPVWRGYNDVLVLKQYDGFFPFSPNEIRLQNFLLKDKLDLPDDVSKLYAVHLYHNLLTKNDVFREIKERSIDSYSWLKESTSYGAEVFRSILPSNFTKEHFDTTKACIPMKLLY